MCYVQQIVVGLIAADLSYRSESKLECRMPAIGKDSRIRAGFFGSATCKIGNLHIKGPSAA